MSAKLGVKALSAQTAKDFYKMRQHPSANWCFCVAWYVPTWEGWDRRTAQQNKEFRETLFKGGVYDGYLLYLNEEPIGWIQVVPLKLVPKLGSELGLKTAVDAHVIGCMEILPEYRKKKLSRAFLTAVLKDLKTRGIKNLLAIPKSSEPGEKISDGEAWTGPEKVYASLGFTRGEIVGKRVVYYKDLSKA